MWHMHEEVLLLDGESAEWSARDADHWVGVYTELVNFCRQALQSGEAGDAVRLQRRLVQLEKRLAFWAGPPAYKSLT